MLDGSCPEEEVLGIVTDAAPTLGAEYTRDPEKKAVLLQYSRGQGGPAHRPDALLPFLDDMSDDVKIAALKTPGARQVRAGARADPEGV